MGLDNSSDIKDVLGKLGKTEDVTRDGFAELIKRMEVNSLKKEVNVKELQEVNSEEHLFSEKLKRMDQMERDTLQKKIQKLEYKLGKSESSEDVLRDIYDRLKSFFEEGG